MLFLVVANTMEHLGAFQARRIMLVLIRQLQNHCLENIGLPMHVIRHFRPHLNAQLPNLQVALRRKKSMIHVLKLEKIVLNRLTVVMVIKQQLQVVVQYAKEECVELPFFVIDKHQRIVISTFIINDYFYFIICLSFLLQMFLYKISNIKRILNLIILTIINFKSLI